MPAFSIIGILQLTGWLTLFLGSSAVQLPLNPHPHPTAPMLISHQVSRAECDFSNPASYQKEAFGPESGSDAKDEQRLPSCSFGWL